MVVYGKLVKLLVVTLLSALLVKATLAVVGLPESGAVTAVASSTESTVDVQSDALVSPGETDAFNPNPPDEVAKLVFIHHSCGNNWLDDGNGDLSLSLGRNNYYVSDVYSGWGPERIGSYTDIGHWWLWFRSEDSSIYLSALYTTTFQNATYTRPMPDPGGENEIVMFKSCYPNSNLKGNPDDPATVGDNPLRGESVSSPYHTVGNAKGIYNDILEYFRTRQDKLFVVITAPPVRYATYADSARAFNNWLVNDWLDDYPYHNVVVFDFYNVLTTNGGDADTNDYGMSTGNHHRVVTVTMPITIEHITGGDDDESPNILEYPTGDGTNNHPSPAGNQKATGEFVPLLNVYYNCWKHGDCWDGVTDWISIVAAEDVARVYPGETATYTLSLDASAGLSSPVTLTLTGAPSEVAAAFDPDPVTAPGTSQLHITTTLSTLAGIYPLTVTGTADGLGATVDLTLIVASATPSFTLDISPTTRVAEPNQTVSYTVTVTGVDGFSEPVTLAVVGLPTGVGAAWSINPATPDASSILTLSVPSAPLSGRHPLHVVGVADTQIVSKEVELILPYPFGFYLPIVLK